MKKNKRQRERYPALVQGLNLKIRQEVMDQDYINKLSDEEKDWLNRFNEEYVNTNFNHPGDRVHPKKYKTKKVKATGRRRKIDVYKQESEKRNNKRNNDSFSVTKRNGMLKGENRITRPNIPLDATEDAIITYIDEKNKIENEPE